MVELSKIIRAVKFVSKRTFANFKVYKLSSRCSVYGLLL